MYYVHLYMNYFTGIIDVNADYPNLWLYLVWKSDMSCDLFF